ncbi:MAG: chromosomal replication initiator protein DnaA [Candidatus Omnitrophota bacterium]
MEQIWKAAKDNLKKTLGEVSINTWIAPLQFKKMQDENVVIEVPDSFFKNWIESHYASQIKDALELVVQKKLTIAYEINSSILKKRTNKIFNTMHKSFCEEPQTSLRLNPRFTFEEFIVGSSNRMAHAASLAVANAPGKSYNPLFIYGGVGLGKTHLMQAIAHKTLSKKPQTKVKYLSSEKFTNELIVSIRNRSTDKFREKYRDVDILLIDDIHFLSGKEAAQEEFFHTFNTLYDYQKQIIISSDKLPREIPKLEERLVSRFSCGLIVDIQTPDFETRVAILQKKLERDPIKIDDEIIHFIADNIKTNIRELEGALVRIIAYSLIEDKSITLDLTKDILKDVVKEIYKRLSPDNIIEKVAAFYGLSKEELKKSKRSKNIVMPRQVAMYLIRELTELSLPEIGRLFGAKHHTTILYAFRKISSDIKTDKHLKQAVNALSEDIKR